MKAIIKMFDGEDFEVVGEDLHISVNALLSILEIIDRASNRVIFSANKVNVRCAYIWDIEDLPVREAINN